MKNFKMMPVAVALVASFAAAQSNEDVQKQLARQDAELKRLNAELTELKANGAMTAADAALETEVNRLSERLAAATTVKSGANQITFVGEFRSRYMLTNSDAAGTDRSNFNLVRVGTHYDFSKDITAALSLQNDYITGQGIADNDFRVYESWVEMRNLFGMSGLTLKHGRQEFVKGTQFQFGNEDWNNGLVWDGHRLDWSNESFGVTGFLFNETGNFTTVDDYTSGLYGTLKSIKDITVDGYWIRRDAFNSDTFGGRVGGMISGIDFNGEIAVQDANLADDPMALELNAGYMFSKDNKFHAHAQYALLENGYVAPALNLGADRYGYALSFAGSGFPTGAAANLESFSVGVSFDPAAAWSIGANVFFNDTDVAVTADDSYTEINVGVDYRYSDNCTISLGLGYWIPGDDTVDEVFLGYLQARLAF